MCTYGPKTSSCRIITVTSFAKTTVSGFRLQPSSFWLQLHSSPTVVAAVIAVTPANGVLFTRCRILDFECWILNAGYWMQDIKPRLIINTKLHFSLLSILFQFFFSGFSLFLCIITMIYYYSHVIHNYYWRYNSNIVLILRAKVCLT